jgi:lipopolysaccharide/colanic/teichoic acid biosynthesis glycosyltransferase
MLRTEDDNNVALMGDALPLSAALRGSARLEEAPPRSLARSLALKAAMDRIGAAAVLVLTSPVLIAIALAVWLSSSGPILYRQRRVGLHGREFTILKFRTMVDTAEPHGEADAPWAAAELGKPEPEPPPERSTAVGRMLRRAGLDELPQLVNVLRGEMALVGPRPERTTFVCEFERHIPGYRDRHRMRPGLTGWAQVHGLRGQTSLSSRTQWDNEYIDRWSLWLDLRILLRTPLAIIAGTRDVAPR